jgi:ABC-type multidrug transport system fused ATPase/permease subunit
MTSSLTPYLLLRRLLKRNAGKLALALFWSILFALLPMQVPILTGALIDGLTGHVARFHGFRLGGERPAILYAVSFGLLIVALAYGLSAYFRKRTVGRVGKIVVAETRQTLLARLETMPLSDHAQFGAAELMHRYLSDTGKVRQYSQKVIVQALTNVVRIGYPALALFWMNATLAMIVFVVFPAQWAINRFLQKRLLLATAKARARRPDRCARERKSRHRNGSSATRAGIVAAQNRGANQVLER